MACDVKGRGVLVSRAEGLCVESRGGSGFGFWVRDSGFAFRGSGLHREVHPLSLSRSLSVRITLNT